MVLYKYCPKCYSLNISVDNVSGEHKCKQCNYTGPISQDSIDKINVMKRSKDVQRYAAANSSTKPTIEIKKNQIKEDPYNEDIDEIENLDLQNDKEEIDDLESRQSNIMKRSAQPEPETTSGLKPKSGLSLKERLKAKGGGKDWDIL